MTVSVFAEPSRPTPPSTQLSWAQFLSESLDRKWRVSEWDSKKFTFTGIVGTPATNLSICYRGGCTTVVDGDSNLCAACLKVRGRIGKDEPLPPRAPPKQSHSGSDAARHFSLGRLAPVVRDEVLYGLQDHDRQQFAIRPQLVRLLVEKIPDELEDILDLPDASFSGMRRSLLRSIQQSVRRLRVIYTGSDGTSGDIWDCVIVGLRSRPDQPYLAVTGHLDFTVIRQRWLRDITLDVLRARRPRFPNATATFRSPPSPAPC